MGEGPRYFRVSPRFWDDAASWSDDAKLLALYILTCHHRTSEGLFRLPKAYAREDMEWSQERFEEGFRELLEAGFIDYDETARVVLIRKALKYQQPANENVAKSAVDKLKELPETRLWQEFRQLAEQYSEHLGKQLREQFGEPQALALPQSHAHPPACEDDAADHGVSLNGFGSGFPTAAELGKTLAGTVAAWVEGKGAVLTEHERRSDDYRRLIEALCEHADWGTEKRKIRSVVHGIICEYYEEAFGAWPADKTSRKLRSFISEYRHPATVVWGLAEAIMHDADELADYARKVIESKLKAAS